MEAKTLHLTLKKKWFDMILSGEKKEEYRELKTYWLNRLTKDFSWNMEKGSLKINEDKDVINKYSCNPVEFSTITFKNGYAKNSPEMIVECLGIQIEYGVQSWGAELGKKYFVISLGKILTTKNIKP